MTFKSAILASALALVASSALAAGPAAIASNAAITNMNAGGQGSTDWFAGNTMGYSKNDPAMMAINTAIDLTKLPARAYNCPQPASVKTDTCSIHSGIALTGAPDDDDTFFPRMPTVHAGTPPLPVPPIPPTTVTAALHP